MSERAPRACAILLAAGSGSRMQGSVDDKILHNIADKPVWRHSFNAFETADCIDSFVIVHRDAAQKEAIASELPEAAHILFTLGGKERQDSVWAGLQAAPADTEIVLIHDCARPLIEPSAIQESIEAAKKTGAASLARS